MKDTNQLNQDHIGRLLRLAGPRPSAPREREQRVKQAVHEEWRERVRTDRRRWWLVRGGIGLAAAASLLAMMGILYRPELVSTPAFEGPVGTIETLSGTVRLERVGAERTDGQILRVGDVVHAGTVIDTGLLGRAAIRLGSGSSVRLDHGTRLRGVTDAAVVLESGALYFDSGGEATGVPVEVRTGLGVLQDIGTQYEVRLGEDELRVRVREGAVNLERDGRLFDASVGVELTVHADGDPSRRSVPVFGPDWEWILAVAPLFELEGRTLDVFLAWVSRETGWRSSFEDARIEAGAPEVVLHGSIGAMRPGEALDAVLPTCGLAHRLEGGILRIEAEGS